jgi:hypothetical protein
MIWRHTISTVCVLFCAISLRAADNPPAEGNPAAPAARRLEVKIVNVATGKVLAPQNDSSDDGVKMELSNDEDKAIRQWRLEKDDDSYKLINGGNEKLLDVYLGRKEEETPIIQWPEKTADNGGINLTGGLDNQRWLMEKFDLENPKPMRIKSKFSELVLDVDNSGNVVQRSADENSKSQLWKIVDLHPTKFFKLVNANTGWVLALEADSTSAGARAVLAKDVDHADKNYKDRQWRLVLDGDNYTLVHRTSKLALAGPDSKEEDQPITLGQNKPGADTDSSQRWVWDDGDVQNESKPAADQPRRLKSKSSDLVLDVDDDGNVVQRRANDKSKSQLWRLVEIKD